VSAKYAASDIRSTRIPAAAGPVNRQAVPERVLTVRLDGSAEYQTRHGERHVPAGRRRCPLAEMGGQLLRQLLRCDEMKDKCGDDARPNRNQSARTSIRNHARRDYDKARQCS
jgi:hypothetical protein